MALAALIGGLVGGKIASRIPAKLLRWIVIVVGLGMSAVYFARLKRALLIIYIYMSQQPDTIVLCQRPCAKKVSNEGFRNL